jgi:hypothetical protein
MPARPGMNQTLTPQQQQGTGQTTKREPGSTRPASPQQLKETGPRCNNPPAPPKYGPNQGTTPALRAHQRQIQRPHPRSPHKDKTKAPLFVVQQRSSSTGGGGNGAAKPPPGRSVQFEFSDHFPLYAGVACVTIWKHASRRNQVAAAQLRYRRCLHTG